MRSRRGRTPAVGVIVNVQRSVVAWCSLVAACVAHAGLGAADGAPEFARDVRPILAERCWKCHGAEKQRGGLRMDALAHLLKGGDNGPVAAPGDPDASKMVAAVRWTDPETRMPPKQKLTDSEIESLARWVQLGMPWPTGATPKR